MRQKVCIFWFRRDLRLTDNAGLFAALSSGLPVVPLFIFDTEILNRLPDKDDKRVSFIYAALQKIQEALIRINSTLDVRYGSPEKVFGNCLEDYDVKAVYTNEDYEPYATERDAKMKALLLSKGADFITCKDQVIFEKNTISKDDGTGYMVFTPYSKKWKSKFTVSLHQPYLSENLQANFFKAPSGKFPSLKEMGFQFNSAIPAVDALNETIVKHYHQTRNTPSVLGTTRMGVHLRFGTVSVRHLVAKAVQLNETFLNELIWREFFMQVLWRHPRVAKEACKKEYDKIRWRNNEAEFERWCQGQTGYPIIDAGMRELNETGFMHNRVRMIAGSFLVKDLLIDWRWGEAYFARKLLDFELAANNGNWQWVAGGGCDAAPYFRVFNPTIQAKKFDPLMLYIRKWVPEIDTLGYATKMVDHDYAKQRCLKAYKEALQKNILA